MPDPSSETSRINYGQRDDTSRRLWNTQIGKANPWEHRAPGDQAEAAPIPAEAPGDEPEATTIAQHDRLRLKRPGAAPANPFERLIEHQLNIQLPKE